jgi:septin family protein
MKEIGQRVNLIPVIAKGDTVSQDALKHYKTRVIQILI